LAPGTTYHFQLVATNSAGSVSGADLKFTTPVLPAVATTLAASGLTPTNATLNGTVNPGGGATAAYFQYGTDTNYGSFSVTNNLAATNTTLSVSNLISSLSPGTTYHFQLVAINSAGTSLGGDLVFTTVSTTVSGTVYAPNGTDPVYNALVYVPNGGSAPTYGVQPITPGVHCGQFGSDVTGSPLVSTFSAADGSFTLRNMPSGNVPLVIQIGRWRRKITITNRCRWMFMAMDDARRSSSGRSAAPAMMQGRS